MNRIRIVALVLAIGVVPLAIGVFFLARDSREYSHAALDTALAGQSRTHAAALDDYFRRARSTILLAAQESAFAKFYESDGGRVAKIRSGGPVVDKLNGALAYLERLYPGAIGEACVIDGTGAEAGRVVRGAGTAHRPIDSGGEDSLLRSDLRAPAGRGLPGAAIRVA